MLIKQNSFGGLAPSVKPRQLGDNFAQVAHNILASVGDFNPLPGDVTVVANSGTFGPQTIYRMQRVPGGAINTDPAVGWKVYGDVRHFLHSQVNGDTTERTMVTVAGGGSPPRVFDVNGTDRLAGLPRPTEEIGMQVQSVPQFDTSARDNSVTALTADLLRLNRDALVVRWLGVDHPGSDRPGLVDVQAQTDLAIGPDSMLRVYSLSSTGGADNGVINETYVFGGPDPAAFGWVLDGSLGGIYRTSTATWPGWVTSIGRDHWGIPFPAFGRAYSLDVDAYIASLRAQVQPGTDQDPPPRLYTEDQVADLTNTVLTTIAQADAAAAPDVAAIKTLFETVLGISDNYATGTLAGTYDAFYAGVDLDAAFSAFAGDCWNTANSAAHAVLGNSGG